MDRIAQWIELVDYRAIPVSNVESHAGSTRHCNQRTRTAAVVAVKDCAYLDSVGGSHISTSKMKCCYLADSTTLLTTVFGWCPDAVQAHERGILPIWLHALPCIRSHPISLTIGARTYSLMGF